MEFDIDELRPVIHQHVCMLTTAGHSPARAISIATHVAVLLYSDFLEEQIEAAKKAVKPGKFEEST